MNQLRSAALLSLCLPLQYLHAFINEVTILVPVLNDSKHTFAIYTPERTRQRWPMRLAAATELEMHDWVCANMVEQLTEKSFYSCGIPEMLSTIYHNLSLIGMSFYCHCTTRQAV